MPRFKPVDQGAKLLPVDFDKQVQPGSFEHALCDLVDHELDLTELRGCYRDDVEGASAYDPAVLLKIVRLAYSRGIVGSRKSEVACREHVRFMVVSGDSQPHFTTLADCISRLGEAVARLFAQVRTVCDRQGLIGREMCAIDGVKLPSHAAKAKSGTREAYRRELGKMGEVARKMLAKHRDADVGGEALPDREAKKLARLPREAGKLQAWLAAHPEDKKRAKGRGRLSNRTDHESAKMATAKGVIQGYTGVVAVDEKHQIVVEAQAHGTGSEPELLVPVVDATERLRTPATLITADAGSHSADHLKERAGKTVEASIGDHGYRQRDERYGGQAQHQDKPDPLWDKRPQQAQMTRFGRADFRLAEDGSHGTGPAGQRRYSNGSNGTFNGDVAMQFRGAQQDCVPCPRRTQCLRTPEKTKTRQVACFQGQRPEHESHPDRMKARIDSDLGRPMIARRVATVEPVFGNWRHNKRLDRFTLRGRAKVEGPWKLSCLTHNIEKLAHDGYAQ
jgi:transposase